MKRLGVLTLLLLTLTLGGCGEQAAPAPVPTESPTQAPTQAPSEGSTQVPTEGPPPEPTQEPTRAPVPEPVEPPFDPVAVMEIPGKGDFVRVQDVLPELPVELKYATADNFTGQVIYDFQEAYLRWGTVEKLLLVQQELAAQGLSLKIWDAYRPKKAQFDLWAVYPDPVFVASPYGNGSPHSRGNTLDVTLVDAQGRELPMPTAFDDFSGLADRDYSDCTPETRANALLLENTMKKYGFTPYWGEWWHFSDTDYYVPPEDFLPGKVLWYACREAPLRGPSGEQATLPAGAPVRLLTWSQNRCQVAFREAVWYVDTDAIARAQDSFIPQPPRR